MTMSDEKVLRVYADGVFDNFHIGHSNMFKQCREAFPNQKIWLIAGVCSQRDVVNRKGSLFITQAQPLAHNGKDTKWSASADTSTRCTRALHGISLRVLLNLFRIHKRNENRLRVP